MADAITTFSIPAERVYTDYRRCLEETRPDLVILCPATSQHGEWTRRVAPYGVHILIEKPFAASLAEADDMIAQMQATGKQLAINWPLAWYPSHRTAKRLVDEGQIGRLIEVHYYGGNRGPLWHTADKAARTAEQVAAEKPHSWFYRRAHGGGSLLDYLGYGTTLGTWFLDNAMPLEVTAVVDDPEGLEVDEQSVTVARYEFGLCTYHTRWGTFTDPWTHLTQPRTGFVLLGTDGTILSSDYEDTITIQNSKHPDGHPVKVDVLQPPFQDPVQYIVDCVQRDIPVEGPLSTFVSRIGQQIVDTALRSAQEKRTLPLVV